MSWAVLFNGHALWLVQYTSNFRATHGACSLWAQLENLRYQPR